MKKHEREVRKEIADLGLKIIAMEQGKHYKITVQLPNGETRIVVCSESPSDHRARHKRRALLKRLLQESGQEPVTA